VVRTRVGYAGGGKENPTYHSLGDHSEAIQIDFDPSRVSYGALLKVFAETHEPFNRSWSRQYASIIFYHGEEQQRAAQAFLKSLEEEAGHKVQTEILPFRKFYLAEDYHQKHSLRGRPEIAAEYYAVYPDLKDFLASTAVTRANGYAGGYGNQEGLKRDLPGLGLSPKGQQSLSRIISRR
jgi:peptide-methionine (S)-S-oxide reductase